MWVISLRIKGLLIVIVLAILSLTALGLLSLHSEKQGYDRLLLVRSADGRAALTPGQAESFCEDEFLVTYEIETQTTAEAHNYRQPAVMTGTNSCYAQIMGNRMVSGSFFTKAAWKAQSREVVLNVNAAFQLFGSEMVVGQLLRIEGQSWIVAGVLEDDETDEIRIYAPSSVTGGQIGDLMVLLDDATVNADYARNALKQLGLYENNFTFVNLAAAAALFSGRFWVAIRAALCLMALFLIRFCYSQLSRRLPEYRTRLQEVYLRELLELYRKEILKTGAAALGFLAGLAALLTLTIQILSVCLRWQGIIPADETWTRGAFAAKVLWLHTYHPWGVAVFVVSLILLILIWIFSTNHKTTLIQLRFNK